MTTDTLGIFFFRRPFVGFDIYLIDGRVVRLSHPETAAVGKYLTTVLLVDVEGRSEIIDTAMIVSCRTLQPVPVDLDGVDAGDGDGNPDDIA